MKTSPFWHEAAPPEEPSGADAPDETDVAIVGAGFTGLNAAKTLAEAGRHAVVFEKGPPGAGASTRNGGMIGWGHRTSVSKLAKRYGPERGQAILAEARLSLDYTTGLIDSLDGETG
ncbi:MAG: FAD-binding oxidoreductase, partial [Pseudomonadota bacterium]